MAEPLTARERIEAHRVAIAAEDLARKAPWAAWVLLPLARMIRDMDAELEAARGEDNLY